MMIVIVKGGTFGSFEKKVPDQVPLTSVAACCPEEAVASGCPLPASIGGEAKREHRPATSNNQRSKILDKALLVMATLHKKEFITLLNYQAHTRRMYETSTGPGDCQRIRSGRRVLVY